MDPVFEVRHHGVFKAWLKEQGEARDRTVIQRVTERLKRVKQGNLGRCKSVGDDVSELILDFGPGYRIYYTLRGRVVIVLLCAGDKSDQKKNIKLAQTLAKEV